MIKQQINNILKKYGLPTVKKQNGIFEKSGIMRYHEYLESNSYGFIRCPNSPQINLFVNVYIKSYCIYYSYNCYIGAWDNINLKNFDVIDFEKQVKEFVKDLKEE